MNTTKLLLGTRSFSSHLGLASRLAAAKANRLPTAAQAVQVGRVHYNQKAATFMPSVSMRSFGGKLYGDNYVN